MDKEHYIQMWNDFARFQKMMSDIQRSNIRPAFIQVEFTTKQNNVESYARTMGKILADNLEADFRSKCH